MAPNSDRSSKNAFYLKPFKSFDYSCASLGISILISGKMLLFLKMFIRSSTHCSYIVSHKIYTEYAWIPIFERYHHDILICVSVVSAHDSGNHFKIWIVILCCHIIITLTCFKFRKHLKLSCNSLQVASETTASCIKLHLKHATLYKLHLKQLQLDLGYIRSRCNLL